MCTHERMALQPDAPRLQLDAPNLSRCASQVLLGVTVEHAGYRAESGAVYASAQEVRG